METQAESNKRIVRTLVEQVWNGRNLDAIADLIDEAHVNQDPACAALGQGPGAYTELVSLWAIAPEIHFHIEEMIAEGDRVATRWSVTSAYHVKLTGMTMHSIAGGKIVRSWSNWDAMGLMHAMRTRERAARQNAL